MRKNNDVSYDPKTVGKKGYLVTLYRYDKNNAEETTVVMRFDPNKVDGFGVSTERGNYMKKIDYKYPSGGDAWKR